MVYIKNEFGVWDYVIFSGMLVVSLGIGVFFALRGGKQKTQGEYLLANRNMSIIPVAISILVSFMSAILILGTPAEMYTQGTEFYINNLGQVLGIIAAAVLFIPMLYPLKITSTFEYLELRFKSRGVRLTGTLISIFTQTVYMGIASFAPSTALNAVTGFPVWATILIVGAVGTFYTTIGGMKAVVWTDVFQSAVMVSGMLAIIIQGCLKVGGIGRVWEFNEKWDRIQFFNFDPDPTVRQSFWSLVVGGSLGTVGTYAFSQASVQRFSCLPTLRNARISIILNMFGSVFLITLACLSGVVIFAYYADQDCDPLGAKLVDNSNQLVPFFVMETLGFPGIPGLFIASLFSGALSSVSSSLNALAAITWEDILKPHFDKKLTESRKTAAIKLLVSFYGLLGVAMGFMAMQLEGTVLQAALSFTGAVSAPLTGLFFLGAFFPWANAYGAIIGSFASLALSLWLSVGAYVTGISLPTLAFPNGTCDAYHNNISMDTVTTTEFSTTVITTEGPNDEGSGPLQGFYQLSYLWYTAVGMASTIIVGLIVSFITGANSIHDVPTKYQIPLFSRIFCCLPESWLYTLDCKRHFQAPEDILAEEKGVEIVVEPPEKDSSVEKQEMEGFGNSGYEEKPETKETINGAPTNGAVKSDLEIHPKHSKDMAPPPYVTLLLEGKENANDSFILERF